MPVSVLKHRFVIAVLVVMLGIGIIPNGVVLGQEQNNLKLSVQAGLGGYCRTNNWIPVKVSLDNTGSNIEGLLEVIQNPVGANQKIYAQTVSLPNQSHKSLSINIYPEGYLDSLSVVLVANGQILASTKIKMECLSSSNRLYGIMADSITPFNLLSALTPTEGHTYVVQIKPDDFPDKTDGLEGLDLLVISGVDSGVLSLAQQEALSTWVAGGGQILVTGGMDWKRTASGIGALIPMRLQGTQSIAGLGALAQYVGRNDVLINSTSVVQGEIKPGTQVLVSQDNIPLVLKRSIGLGKMIYLTFDPTLEPFASWGGGEAFYRSILGEDATRPVWAWGFQDWDRADQAINSLPNIKPPHAIGIMAFLLFYIIIIGPGNYLFLRKINRREWAWITIPTLVILISLVAFLLGMLGLGNQTILNRLAVVQIKPDSNMARLDGLVGIFSPYRATYKLQVSPGLLVNSLPDNNKNLNVHTPNNWMFIQQPGVNTVVPDILVDVGGIEAVAVQGQIPAPDIYGELTLELNGSNGRLAGDLVNNSDLLLENSVLLTPGGVQKLGPLQPRSRLNIQFNWQTTNMPASINGFPRPANGSMSRMSYSGDDSWMAALIDGSNYYASAETYQRYALISALTGTSSIGTGIDSGIYLAGWSQLSPLDAKMIDRTYSETNATLYLVRLNNTLSVQSDQVELQPAYFSWRVLENSGSIYPSPYNSYLQQGSYSLVYVPIPKISFKSIESLTLHLVSTGGERPLPFSVHLWNNSKMSWERQDISSWGDHVITNPAQYLNSNGEVRMQINIDGNSSSAIKQADFTLIGSP